MGKIKMNLDMLEEVRSQHEIAMNATEAVIKKGRADLNSLTEEVWEGEDGDMARELLDDLLNKEMAQTWSEVDAIHEDTKKAQKKAYEAKNFCNKFSQIFRDGTVPSDKDSTLCSGDLMCDKSSCEQLKANMDAAASSASSIKSNVERAEIILAELETDEAKFDYSSYTETIKIQTQNVIDRVDKFNNAVTKYEQKVEELDQTFSQELMAAIPSKAPIPFDPSVLLSGDLVHMKDGDIINFLEAHNVVDIGGKFSDAHLANILKTLFDKKDIDVSTLSEKDLGMAFINLPEDKKKAVLLEMGFTKDQIDSILESCKDSKTPTAGAFFAKTLIDKIADKNGNRYSKGKEASLTSALGLTGIKGPNRRDFGIGKTNAEINDVADGNSATSGTTPTTSKEKSKGNQNKNNKPARNTNSTGNSSSSTPSTQTDPNAQYKTGITAVDEKIDELFVEYGNDLSGLTLDQKTWDSLDEETRVALAAIYERSMISIDKCFHNSECDRDRALAGNILHTTLDFASSAEEPKLFNPYRINWFESYLNPDWVGYRVVQHLKDAVKSDGNNWADASFLIVNISGADISFGFKNANGVGEYEEKYLFTSEDRNIRYIEWCKDNNPLELYNDDEGKYEFELLFEKNRFEGYELTAEEKRFIAQLFDKYFGVYDDGRTPSEKELDIQNKLLKTCVHVCESPEPGSNYIYETDTKYIIDIMRQMTDKNSMAYVVLANFAHFEFDGTVGLSTDKASYHCLNFNIKRTDAGITIEYDIDTMENDNLGPDEVTNPGLDNKTGEVSYNISNNTALQYIKKLEVSNPDVFSYEYSLFPDDCDKKNGVAKMYMAVSNTADFELIDSLMKADSTYEGVFDGNPDGISASGATAFGQYGNNLLLLAQERGGAYETSYNNFLSKIVTPYNSGNEDPDAYAYIGENGYIEKYAMGCSLATETYLVTAWATDRPIMASVLKEEYGKSDYEVEGILDKYDEELLKQLEIARLNEEIAFALAGYVSDSAKNVVGADIKLQKDDTKEIALVISNHERFRENGTTVVKVSDQKNIQLFRHGGAVGIGDITGSVREELNNKKCDFAKNLWINTAIDLVTLLFPKWMEVAIKGTNMIIDHTVSSFAAEASTASALTAADSLGETGFSAASTLYSAIAAYESKLEDINVTLEVLKQIDLASTFYTVHSYETLGGKQDYYVKLDDFNMIRLIQNWSHKGIAVLYSGMEYKDEIHNINVNYNSILSDTKDAQMGEFSEEEIERALNTLIYGKDSGKDSYASILDIPTYLLLECIKQINDALPENHGQNLVQDRIYDNRIENIDSTEEEDG